MHTVKTKLNEDKNPPIISMEESELLITIADGDVDLLDGVSALDKEDGDLSDMIQVASVSPMAEGSRTVKYIVFDKANNCGTAQRIISYADYQPPRIHLKDDFNVSLDELDRARPKFQITATDVLDGDITEKISVTYETGFGEATGTYSVSFYAQNSVGDSLVVPVNVTIYDGKDASETGKYYPVLSDYILYVKK